MKKFISLLSLAALVSAAACQKLEEPVQESPSASSHKVYFVAEEEMTKTAIAADADKKTAAFTWENTLDSYVHLFENGTEGESPAINISDNGKKATLSADFDGITVGTFNYTAVVAGHYSNGVPSVPELQHPAASSFDPAADVLLGKANTVYIRPHDAFDFNTAKVSLNFARANAVTRLVLTGLKAGEKVEIVEIAAGKEIAGPLKSLNNGTYQGFETAKGSKRITLEFSENNVVAADGTFVTYFTSWAVAPETFGVTVATDKGMYAKTAASASGLSFKRDILNNISVNLENQIVASSRFELVTGIPSSWDGTYIIVNTNKEGNAKALMASSKSSGYSADVVVKNMNGKLYVEASETVKDLAWDFTNTGKKDGDNTLWNVMTGTARIILSSAQYLYDDGGITVSSYNYSGFIFTRKYYYHMFSADENGVQMTSLHDGKKTYMRYNGSAFEYTSDASNRVYVYKYNDTERESQVLAYEKDAVNFTIADGKYEIGKTYDGQPFTSSSKYQKDLLSFSSSDTSIATVDSEGRITIKKQGTVTITATASANSSYRGASASYDVRIYTPYYQKISSLDELTVGDKYIIVSTTELLGTWYHAFCATNTDSYDYDINTLSTILSSPILDGGKRIKPSAALDANQVVIEQNILSMLTGKYTIKPLSVNKYLYCNTEISSFVSEDIPFPTYEIAFAESSGSSWLSQLEQIATAPHTIKFDENGAVTLTSGYDNLGLGGNLFYSKIINEFSYVNLKILDNFSDITELIAYLGQNSEYAALLKFINALGQNISIKDLVSYFSADMYLYKYID